MHLFGSPLFKAIELNPRVSHFFITDCTKLKFKLFGFVAVRLYVMNCVEIGLQIQNVYKSKPTSTHKKLSLVYIFALIND